MFFSKCSYFFTNFLFPKKCEICGKRNVEYICDKCFNRLKRYERFSVIDFRNNNLSQLIYFFKYEKIIRKLILQFKFLNKPYLSKVFSKIILKNEKLCGKIKFYDIIIPVPMHKHKKALRGYNQTELIAHEIADKLGINYNENLLQKIKNNKMQSKLSEKERYKNIQNVFEVADSRFIKDKKIVLIDDICTTGATLEECARVLKLDGAKEVCGLVIAKD